MERLRVLQLLTRMNVGGPAKHVLELVRRPPEDVSFTVAAGTPPGYEGRLPATDVPIVPLPLVRDISPGNDLRAARELRRLLAAGRFRVLHTHMAKAGAIGRTVVRSLPESHRPSTVHTFHGHVLEAYFSRPFETAIIAAERWLARRTDALVAVSQRVRDDLLELGIGHIDQWHVVPLGFDLEAFEGTLTGELRTRLRIPADVVLVGVVGRLAPIKDQATALRSMAILPRDVHLVLIGDGQQRTQLERLAQDLRVADRVHFAGWVSDIASELHDLDIVALTSRNEGTPVSLIEAGAAGRPVVATSVGGVADVVTDEETGFLVPPGDPSAVAERILRLAGDVELRRVMGQRARMHMRRRFDRDRMIHSVRAIYRELEP